jgi:ATP-dependent Lon protease
MNMNYEENIRSMPIIALRGITIFPGMILHFDVGREASIRALDEAMDSNQTIFLVAQKDLGEEDPKLKDLCAVGTIAHVQQILRLPGNNVRVMVEGIDRGSIVELYQEKPYLLGSVQALRMQEMPEHNTARVEAMVRQTYDLFERYSELSDKVAPDVILTVMGTTEPGYLADYIAQNIVLRGEDKQAILDELKPIRRLSKLNQLLRRENRIQEMDQELQNKTKERMNDSQRDYYLREQLKVIQEELGEDEDNESAEYRKRIAEAKLPQQVEEKLLKELRRLEKQPFGSSEAGVLRNYLDICLELPWTKKSKERVNVTQARKILDADHEGLDKVKERILEFIAVKQLAPQLKGQIICLYGPPGVGKTSIAASVAKAMNRKLARVSLGGIHDEAEIRGHRKTYVGAMPGRIITAINQAGTNNPLILLDEIDKVGSDGRSDPAAALLEVLDSEQNATFRDNFIELPFDLSDVLFITTANDLSPIPRPLLDRMEVIELVSYTDEEKLRIARNHLIPRELQRHGLKKSQLRLTDDAIREIITGYTKESGVRRLEQEIASLCRKVAMIIVEGESGKITVTGDQVETYLGTRKYTPERISATPIVGVVNGLAWTQVGGQLLEVEVNTMPGTGKIELTGNLGQVMKESCQAALSCIRSRAKDLGIDPDFYKNTDIHIHFPEGAVPKDGPSAGVTITTAIVSALTGTPVRNDIAMTGEVTLRGRVLAIGGLREKTMAAYRNGIHTVIIPAENEKDLADIDQTVRAALRFVTAEQVDQVLAEALVSRAVPEQRKNAGALGRNTSGELSMNA